MKRGDSLHSRARRAAASRAGVFVGREAGRKRGVEREVDGDFGFVRGDESINEGASDNAANPPIVSFVMQSVYR